jgi:hypothetical protein
MLLSVTTSETKIAPLVSAFMLAAAGQTTQEPEKALSGTNRASPRILASVV